MPSVTKKDLAERLFEKIGLTKRESKKIVDVFFEEMARALERNDNILISNFGNFEIREKKARPGRNPRTNEPVPIEARRVIVFHASLKMKDEIKAPLRDGERD